MHNTPLLQKTKTEAAMLELACQCLDNSREERPELTWLKEVYERQRYKLGLSKAQMDTHLYRKMTGCLPEKSGDTLKIRYWRTGHHVPINRETCRLFGEALMLSESEKQYLLQGYLDKSLNVYDKVPPDSDSDYWKRRRTLNLMISSYMKRLHPPSSQKGETNSNCFRHNYYMDAQRYISQTDTSGQSSAKHIYSIRYDMELSKNIKLLGEIPRKTMIRHLIVLNSPDLGLHWMNERLELFGYLPLSESHTLTGGERLDSLLIGLLKIYEKQRRKSDRQQWLCRCCQELDAFFQQNHQDAFRFMHFKSLD